MKDIEISEDIQKQEWEEFLLQQTNPPFLQSWNMTTLHKQINEEPHCVAVRRGKQLIGVAFYTVVKAKRGHYLYLPYGPVLQEWSNDIFQALTAFLAQKGRDLQVDFIRSSPFITNSESNQRLYSAAGWKRAPIHMLAEHVWILDITPSEDELMKGMRKTMRNLIRRAGRDGVAIRVSTDPSDVDHFLTIHRDTVERHKFTPYTDDYFVSQVQAFTQDDQVALLLAEYKGSVIAASIIMFYGNMASYHHGASLTKYQKVPSTYLLQWTAIQEAKKRGCTAYNFWGIVPEEKMESPILHRKHPFAGVTTFKTGFGGSRLDLLPCHDYALTSKYYITKIIETARRIKRGFW